MPADRFLPKALRSAAFRFAVLLALIFAIGAAALLTTVERQIGGYAHEATDGMLRTEAQVLAGEYAELGQPGLIDAMQRRARPGEDAQFRYLLRDARGRRIYGDLPPAAARTGWNTLRVTEPATPARRADIETMTTIGTQLQGGLLLVVATDNFDVETMRARLGRFTLLSGIAITAFVLLGGFLTGRVFLRRLGRVNHAVDRIIQGDRAERLPMIGFGPEFDELARNLNRMLDRNAAAMEALRQVSTDIAHDLRTPLTRLHQRLEQMQEGGADARAIDEALAQTQGLLATFQALLRIGTLEGGVGRQRFAAVDLTELMDRILAAYQPVAEDADKTLTGLHARDVTVDGDAELLAQLLTNLIENAIMHTPAGTQIFSRLSLVGDAPTIEIADTGPGIPAAERAKVFQRFYRLDASRNTEGAGLGLALVAAVAALHQAEHDIPETGRGLTVRIAFPPGWRNRRADERGNRS